MQYATGAGMHFWFIQPLPKSLDRGRTSSISPGIDRGKGPVILVDPKYVVPEDREGHAYNASAISAGLS
jgi:hypothetical protein